MKKQLQISLILLTVFLSHSVFAQQTGFRNQLLMKNTPTEFKINPDQKLGSKSYKSGDVDISILIEGYLFPSSIDATGNHIIIQLMGNDNNFYYWSPETGTYNIEGDGKQISNNLTVTGNMLIDNFQGSGETVEAAGTFDLETNTWTFLGMNEGHNDVISEIYNSAWDISDDGETIVGLQMKANSQSFAFIWTEEDGYNNFGEDFDYSSRASGISRNGEMVFGWARQSDGTWTPMIYTNNTSILLSPGTTGESTCTSPNGQLVAGRASQMPFYWTADDGIQSFGTADDYPIIIMDDGGVFSVNTIYPPEDRRANYWSPGNEMISFNDYAQARGLEEAQDWIFYSVNDVTPDERIFIGTGRNPAGQDVAFRMEFPIDNGNQLSLLASPDQGGDVNGSGNYMEGDLVEISANPNLHWEFVNWTDQDGNEISTEEDFTYTMPNEDMQLTAHFIELPTYTLELAATPIEGGEIDGAGDYYSGDMVNLIATANENYVFENWKDENGNIISEQANTYYAMPENDILLIAHFQLTQGLNSEEEAAIKIYPNPLKDQLFVQGLEKEAQVKIYSIHGKLMKSDRIIKNNQSIDVSYLDAGIYILQISSEQNILNQKIKILK